MISDTISSKACKMDPREANLPVIDFSKARTCRKEVAKQIVDALQDTGFMILENITGTDSNKLHEACEWFFALPDETKMAVARKYWNPKSPKVFRGYFPCEPTDSSNKEAFEFGVKLSADDPEHLAGNLMYEDALWPEEDGTINFKEFLKNYFVVMQNATVEIMRLIALGLGQEEHIFDPMFIDKPLSTFRLLHYPPRKGDIPDKARSHDGKILTCGAHTDSTILTIVETFHYGGLELEADDGSWKNVPSRPGSLVMNIGDMLAQFTGGRLKATKHRVVDIGKDRFSVPFFLEPAYHADISKPPLLPESDKMQKNVVKDVDTKDVKPCKYGHWLIRAYTRKEYFEYRGLKEWLKEM